jgi:hypothetical protein
MCTSGHPVTRSPGAGRPVPAGASYPGWRIRTVSHLIATYGYWAVFALVAVECLGTPLPGETALIIAST